MYVNVYGYIVYARNRSANQHVTYVELHALSEARKWKEMERGRISGLQRRKRGEVTVGEVNPRD